jgi:hypothetical protein
MTIKQITLINYNNDVRDADDTPALEELTVKPLSKQAEKKIDEMIADPTLYDVHDLEWMANVLNGFEIVSRKIVGYNK